MSLTILASPGRRRRRRPHRLLLACREHSRPHLDGAGIGGSSRLLDVRSRLPCHLRRLLRSNAQSAAAGALRHRAPRRRWRAAGVQRGHQRCDRRLHGPLRRHARPDVACRGARRDRGQRGEGVEGRAAAAQSARGEADVRAALGGGLRGAGSERRAARRRAEHGGAPRRVPHLLRGAGMRRRPPSSPAAAAGARAITSSTRTAPRSCRRRRSARSAASRSTASSACRRSPSTRRRCSTSSPPPTATARSRASS